MKHLYRHLRLLIAFSCLFLSGCSFVTSNYGASFENIEAMKNLGPAKFNVTEFTSVKEEATSITCRAAGPVENPNKESFESYIHNAFVSELKLAGLYDEASQVVLSGHFSKLDFSSNIGAGKWTFELVATSTKNTEVKITSTHEFSTNWIADKACQQVAQAFSPAVQNLIKDIISDPGFRNLIN